jgi:hypothetical protein
MILPVQWQRQPDERWCWATVASIISVYYATQFNEGQSLIPCQVATLTLPQPTCCPPNPVTDPPPAACQIPFDLHNALAAIQHLNFSPPSLPGINLPLEEIGNQRPLCAQIKYNGGPFHYVIVNGCDEASQQVTVVDPAGSPQAPPMPFASFMANNSFTFSQWILTA